MIIRNAPFVLPSLFMGLAAIIIWLGPVPWNEIPMATSSESKGQARLSRHDLNGDKDFETVRHDVDGDISRQEKGGNGDGTPDILMYFSSAQPSVRKRDTNYDGRFDVTTLYRNGQPEKEEKDTNFDDISDRVVVFDAQGQPLKMEELWTHCSNCIGQYQAPIGKSRTTHTIYPEDKATIR